MPFYEFVCQACGKQFEELVRSMTSKPKVACPACASGKTVQQLSVFAAGRAEASPSPAQPNPGCASCSDGGCPYAGG